MALLGISLIVASVVYVFIRPPSWLSPPRFLPAFLQRGWLGTKTVTEGGEGRDALRMGKSEVNGRDKGRYEERRAESKDKAGKATDGLRASSLDTKKSDGLAMPPPPPPTIQPPSITTTDADSDEATTPKAKASTLAQPIPSFSLSDPSTTTSPSSMMPPPPPPSRLSQPSTTARIPSLPQFPSASSAQRARGPLPNRGPPSSSLSPNGLAPPPTHSSKPKKPSRQVLLEPGHSPLDWARISGPNSDLRGLDPSASYLRVTPSMLKAQTGRKGKDAWMALNGKVYNVTPYAKFHPGGVPELMRGAAKDGTKLFGEIHPWVNYETMLAACLIGVMVEEPQQGKESEMEMMD